MNSNSYPIFAFHGRSHLMIWFIILTLYSIVLLKDAFIFLLVGTILYGIFFYSPWYKAKNKIEYTEDDDEYRRLKRIEYEEFIKQDVKLWEVLIEIAVHVFYWIVLGLLAYLLDNANYHTMASVVICVLVIYIVIYLKFTFGSRF